MTMTRLFFILTAAVWPQTQQPAFVQQVNGFGVFGGMGIQSVSSPDIVEYINSITVYSQRVNDFSTSVDFFGGCEFPVSGEWGVKLEHSYRFQSYSVPGKNGGTIDFFFAQQSPAVMVQYVITGYGYFVKIGAGGTYHFGEAEQKVSTFGVTTDYTANGAGVKAEIVGQTAFDQNLFGYIGGTLGWNGSGGLKEKNGTALTLPNTATPVTLRSFSAGLRFGIILYL